MVLCVQQAAEMPESMMPPFYHADIPTPIKIRHYILFHATMIQYEFGMRSGSFPGIRWFGVALSATDSIHRKEIF